MYKELLTVTSIFIFIVGCFEDESKQKSFMDEKKQSEKKTQEIEIQVEQAPILRFVEKDQYTLLNKEEMVVKEITSQEIQDSTLKLYVEAVPVDSKTLWKKGNDPRKKEHSIESDNVRVVCLGEEGENYIFMTLRFFMDYTYPNHNIQGITEVPVCGVASNKNANFVSYTKMYRFMLSDVRHTGGGQIKTLKTVPFVVRNLFSLDKKNDYDILSSYTQIGKVKYVNPIKNELTALDVKQMNDEIGKGNIAYVKTFGNHDICILITPKKLWGDFQIKHLGLSNPTETISVLAEKQRYLYGFEFVLMSKEAYQAVMHYKVPDEAKESGIYMLLISATEIMSPQHVMQIKMVDTLIAKTLISLKKESIELLSESELVSLGMDFGKYFMGYRKKMGGK
jgi:hypothetical protein